MEISLKQDQDIQLIHHYMDKLHTAVQGLNLNPNEAVNKAHIIDYFVFSDDVRRMINRAQLFYHTYEAELYFMKLNAQYDALLDKLKKVAVN